MKRLKSYFRSLKLIETEEKKTPKELKNEARDYALLKSFLIFFPFYLIIGNLLFMFIGAFYLLIFVINLLFFLHIFFYQYAYYKYLNLKNYKLPLFKTIIYGLILSVIVWVISYIVGGFL